MLVPVIAAVIQRRHVGRDRPLSLVRHLEQLASDVGQGAGQVAEARGFMNILVGPAP